MILARMRAGLPGSHLGPRLTWEAEATPAVPAGQLFVETVGATARARQVGTLVSSSDWSRNGAPQGEQPCRSSEPRLQFLPPGSACSGYKLCKPPSHTLG